MEGVNDPDSLPPKAKSEQNKKTIDPDERKHADAPGKGRGQTAANEDGSKGSFGHVYANEKALSQIFSEDPIYPAGSIIVRERFVSSEGTVPNTVIAMVKREYGFSPGTDDWEFLVFDGPSLGVQSRETVGSCATCHIGSKATDWVFRSYIDQGR